MARKSSKQVQKADSKKAPEINLPPDVVAEDLKYPKYPETEQEQMTHRAIQVAAPHGVLTFYRVGGEHARKERGWMIATLFISKGRGDQPDRTYAIGVDDSKVYTVGNGPHVTDEVRVFLSVKNMERLRKYLDLWHKGMSEAGAIRDRISSRRAQGQAHRAAGRNFWNW